MILFLPIFENRKFRFFTNHTLAVVIICYTSEIEIFLRSLMKHAQWNKSPVVDSFKWVVVTGSHAFPRPSLSYIVGLTLVIRGRHGRASIKYVVHCLKTGVSDSKSQVKVTQPNSLFFCKKGIFPFLFLNSIWNLFFCEKDCWTRR